MATEMVKNDPNFAKFLREVLEAVDGENTDNKEEIKRRKVAYYIGLIENAVKDTGKEEEHEE